MNVADLTATLKLDDSSFKSELASTVKKAQSQAKVKVAAEVDSKQADRGISRLTTSLKNLVKNRFKITPDADGTRVQKVLASIQSGFAKIKSGVGSAFSGVGRIGSAIGSKIGSGIEKINGGISKFFGAIGGGLPVVGALGVAVGGVLAGIVAVSAKALMLADSMEVAEKRFTIFTRSNAKTNKILADTKKYADTTPFEFPELQSATLRLVQLNYGAAKTNKTLRQLGDIAAASGTNIDDLTRIYSQMQSTGKVTTEDMNQLIDSGVTSWGELAKSVGVSESEIKKLVETGKVGRKDLNAFWDDLYKRRRGATGALAETLGGQISTFKDTINGILTDFGKGILPIVKAIMPLFQSGAEGFGKKLQEAMPKIVDVVAAGASLLIDLPGHILRAVGTIGQGFMNMTASVQRSLGTVLDGIISIAEGLNSLPGVNIDTTGLQKARDDVNKTAAENEAAGKKFNDSMQSRAAKTDAMLAKQKQQIEDARRAGHNGIIINTTIKSKTSELKKMEKEYKANKAKLEKDPTNVKLQAKDKDLKGKIDRNKKELKQLDKYSANPKLVAKDLASGKIRIVKGRIESVKGKEVKVTVKGDTSGAKAAESAIRKVQSKTVTVWTKHKTMKATAGATGGLMTPAGFAMRGPLRRSDGGPVWGAGTATSDSIQALLSDGEFVIRAAAVKKLGLARLDYMNKMGELPQFSKGGKAAAVGRSLGASTSPVRRTANSSASSGTQRYAFTITNWRDGEGYMQGIAGDVVDTNEYFNASIDRMSLV